MSTRSIVDGIEEGLSVLRVLAPLAESLSGYIFGDDDHPEPTLFEQLPELRAPAALERAKHRARLRSKQPI